MAAKSHVPRSLKRASGSNSRTIRRVGCLSAWCCGWAGEVGAVDGSGTAGGRRGGRRCLLGDCTASAGARLLSTARVCDSSASGRHGRRRPLHPPFHRTLRRARKRLLARPRAAARARALPTGPHAASAAFLKGASRAAAVRRVPRPHAIHATAAEPGSLRPPNRAPRTLRTIPSRLTTQKTRLERGQKPPPPRKHAKCTTSRTHLKHSTPTTQQARVGDTNGGFCVSR